MQVWVLRESFLAYERFHGVFADKASAQAKSPAHSFFPILRTLPDYMEDENDPFHSPEGSEQAHTNKDGLKYLWIVEPHEVP